jgi:hypothetical protein
MGEILKDLARTQLPDREKHNSRLFIDLCENIHIHYRELRIVFSLDEFFEFCSIVSASVDDVNNYLAQNPSYTEQTYGTTLMVAGQLRQRKLLQHSPEPHTSTYFSNDFAIELQTERITDEIHVHWRDYRFALPRDHFKAIAHAFTSAAEELSEYEASHPYTRKPHPDRLVVKDEGLHSKDPFCGTTNLPLKSITTWFQGTDSFTPNPDTIHTLLQHLQKGEQLPPLLVSTEEDGSHQVIDGHHRLTAYRQFGALTIPCVVAPITYQDSAKLRRAESLLKEFDRDTGHKFHTSAFLREYTGHKLNRFYSNNFENHIRPDFPARLARVLSPEKGGCRKGVYLTLTHLHKFYRRLRYPNRSK